MKVAIPEDGIEFVRSGRTRFNTLGLSLRANEGVYFKISKTFIELPDTRLLFEAVTSNVTHRARSSSH